LKRWGRDILGFSPLVEGGYSTRGDRWRLHYAGDRVSHRFTILDNEHFEYDVILNKEPESNRLYLGVQGWEGFDFFRQPDDIGPDILRGSYAVYKKEGVINTPAYHVGTGKLCHIHRPRIIDARGRRVWGDIWINRGVMTMIIPEWWLAEAKYPVVVDPVVGSSVLGAYNSYMYMTQEGYWEYARDKSDDPSAQPEWYSKMRSLEFAPGVVFNKYIIPEALDGWYNTHLYIEKAPVLQDYSYDEYLFAPLLYSDDNNHPEYLLNYETDFASILPNLYNPSSFTPRWIKSRMETNDYIETDSYVWFGHYGRNGAMRFDYGTPFFQNQDYVVSFDALDEYGGIYYEMAHHWNLYDISYMEDDLSGAKANVFPGARYDMKVSMYFVLPVSNERTITQWVKPAEAQKLTGQYQRNIIQTAQNTMSVKGPLAAIRKAVEAVAALYEATAGAGFNRGIGDTAGSEGVALRLLFVFLRLLTGAYIRDYIIGRFLKSKEELIIKSPVCREIVIDSRLH
jgi:hypothetical protein